jgi:hypothetical protein
VVNVLHAGSATPSQQTLGEHARTRHDRGPGVVPDSSVVKPSTRRACMSNGLAVTRLDGHDERKPCRAHNVRSCQQGGDTPVINSILNHAEVVDCFSHRSDDAVQTARVKT